MPNNGRMRVCDQDREAAVAVLRDAYAAGRLDLGELRERAGAAYGARTWDDLRCLTSDLPVDPGMHRPGSAVPYPADAKMRSGGEMPLVARRPAAVMVLIALGCLGLVAAAWQPVAIIPLMILSLPALAMAGALNQAGRHRGR